MPTSPILATSDRHPAFDQSIEGGSFALSDAAGGIGEGGKGGRVGDKLSYSSATAAAAAAGDRVDYLLLLRLCMPSIVVEFSWMIGELVMMPYLIDLGVPLHIANLVRYIYHIL